MTSPIDQGPTAPDLLEPGVGSADTPPSLGLFRFTTDGRAAPGLFVAGWIAFLIGGSATFVGLLAGRTLPGIVLFVAGIAILLVALVLLGGSQAIERRRAGVAYAGPSPVLAMAAVIAGWYLAAIVVVTPLQALGLTVEGPVLALLGVSLQGLVVVGILRLLVVGPGALTWREMGWTPPSITALREFAGGAIFAVPVIVVTGLAIVGLTTLVGQQPASPLPPTGSTTGLLLNLLSGAVIAPVYEEMFFRGFALSAWRLTGRPARAIIRSAVLFAAIHAIDQSGDTFSQAIGVAVVAAGARLPVALALGAIFERRRSLWASIGLHATFNAVLLVLAERALAG